MGGEDWGEGGAGGGGGHHLTPPPSPPTGLEAAKRAVPSPQLGRVESQDQEGEGIPTAPSSEGDPPSGQEGIPPSRQPASRVAPAPATSVNCPPNLHGHSKSRLPAPVHDPALHSPFPSPPPRPPPSSAPPSSRLCPRPRPPRGKFPPPTPPRFCARVTPPARGTWEDWTPPLWGGGRYRLARASQRACVPPSASRAGAQTRRASSEAVTPPRASQWAAGGPALAVRTLRQGKGGRGEPAVCGRARQPRLWARVPTFPYPPETSRVGLGWPAAN